MHPVHLLADSGKFSQIVVQCSEHVALGCSKTSDKNIVDELSLDWLESLISSLKVMRLSCCSPDGVQSLLPDLNNISLRQCKET